MCAPAGLADAKFTFAQNKLTERALELLSVNHLIRLTGASLCCWL